MDLGCCSLQAHRVLASRAGGEPAFVAARGGERSELPGIDEWVDADLVFLYGATGLARCHMVGQALGMTYRIIGTAARRPPRTSYCRTLTTDWS